MNNLHRELAPVSQEAWEDIEQEVARTFKRNLGARRVVDLKGPYGSTFSSLGTGHLKTLKSSSAGLITRQHEVIPVVELRVPFALRREEVDAVERGASDSDWQPAKDAAQKLAYAEDHAVFEGYSAAGMEGLRAGTSNPVLTLPEKVEHYPDVIAEALKQLRLVGVEGPYAIVMGAEAYTLLSEGSDDGYPILKHISRLVESDIVWAPAIEGAFVLSMRGGDFELSLGRDLSIGYQSHTDQVVNLYLEETMVFRLLTSEAVVAIKPAASRKKK